MRKELLNQYIGKTVTITFFDDAVKTGVLGFTSEFCAEQGYRRPGFYTIENIDFRASHVKKLKELQQTLEEELTWSDR